MDFLLATVLSLGIFVGLNAQPAGNLNFACRDGEEYHMCRSPCEPTCYNIGIGTKVNCNRSCIAGCFCKNGLVRASDKTCVLPEDCIKHTIPECKENEEFLECGSPCAVNCTNMNDPIFCTKSCHSGCFCKPDFVRDSKGNCVHPRDCITAGNMQCPMNERYVRCVSYCNTCWESGDCRTPYCNPGCDCKPGFFRNNYGLCVTGQECFVSMYGGQGNCRENEVFSSCVNQCNDCAMRGRCDYEFYCEPGCDCKRGYLRDERGICIPERFCFRGDYNSQCKGDQVFKTCGPACVPTCENYRRLLYHSCRQECVPGCFCPKDLVVGPDGICIQPEYCPAARQPTCQLDEQYYVCIPTCRATCETYNDSSAVCDLTCTKGCFCKGGLIRRQDGACVLPRDCPARTLPCPPGEAFYQCLPTCRTTCESLNNPGGICSTECKPGCFCQPGFVRSKDGKCVRAEECPLPVRPTCPSDQIYYDCIPMCGNTCDNFNLSRPTCQGIKICRPGCFCRRGFVQRRDGKCVRPRNCPIVCRANEEFLSCGSPCPITCENFRERPACIERCARGCFCKSGFVLGPDGRCIPRINCPSTFTTAESIGIEGRRGGTDDGNSTNETTSTPSPLTKTDQSIIPGTTAAPTLAPTKLVSIPTDLVSKVTVAAVTDLVSKVTVAAATDSVSKGTVAAVTDSVSKGTVAAVTDLVSKVTVAAGTAASPSDIGTKISAETTTPQISSQPSSGTNVPELTSLAANTAEVSETQTSGEQTVIDAATTDSPNVTSGNSSVQP